MSNLNENRIDTVLTDAVLTTITNAIKAIADNIPNVTLADVQRNELLSMDVDNLVFANDTFAELENLGPEIMPGYINADRFRKDLEIRAQMDRIESKLLSVVQMVSDCKRVAAHEALSTALSVYHIIKAADKAGIVGARQSNVKLKKRFDKIGGRAPEQL
ncbi:hypothetical protein FLAN108750_00720 [Flavobacterium antarcticum]|uniref:hypothetical protein n=1 Tax=Flavobacterium antarcticum TaxID=271155 RepID=UPI0003B56606|nr:hypothetical protein [Flavobacterium antarcticum]